MQGKYVMKLFENGGMERSFWGCGISERELVVVPSDTSPLAPLNQKLFIIRKE